MATKKQLYRMIVEFVCRNKIKYEGECSSNTLYIGSDDTHKLQFQLKWTTNNHYVVYVVVKNEIGICTPAIASLWNSSDVIFFLGAVLNFNLIYAKRPNPNEDDD